MEWLIFALAVCAIVGIALYMGRRKDGTDPLRLGGGTRFADLGPDQKHRRPGADSHLGGGTR